MLDLTRPPPDRPASPALRVELHSRITVDPKTGYSPELKARVEAEIARARTFEPMTPEKPGNDLDWLTKGAGIDLKHRFENKPPDLDFVWPGFLAGTVGALVAPGATGKSFWALEAMMSIACSVAGGDLAGLKPTRHGKVIYISGEDTLQVLDQRIYAIGAHLTPAARTSISDNLAIMPAFGKAFDVMNELHLVGLIERCRGLRLVVLDTLSRIHCLDENSNSDMAQVVKRLERVADESGASVLYLHHCSKLAAVSGTTDQQQAARGASVLIDNARWCGFVAKMTEDESKRLCEPDSLSPVGPDRRGFFMRFGSSKQNYAENETDIWYMRKNGGVLVPVALRAGAAVPVRAAAKGGGVGDAFAAGAAGAGLAGQKRKKLERLK